MFERKRRRGLDGRERWIYRVCASFVLLANGTTGNEVIDEDGKSRPPKVSFNDGLGAEASKMAREGRGMDGMKERGAGGGTYMRPL